MSPGTLAILLALTSAVLHAIVGVISKSADDILVRRWIQESTPSLIALPFIFSVPWPSADVWPVIILTGIVHLIYQIMQVNAYRLGDFSIVYPVSRGFAPLLAGLGAVLFLDESLTALSAAGLLLACLGLMAFAVDGHRNQTMAHKHLPALLFAFATAAFVAAYTVIDAKGMRMVDNPFTFIVWMFIANGIGITLVSVLWRGHQLLASLAREWRYGLFAGTVSILGYGMFLYAVRLGPIADLSALRETSVIFGALMGVTLLREPFGTIRILGALAVVTGIIVLRLA